MGQRTVIRAARRTGLTGSAFVRLLAGLVGPQASLRDSREAFAQGLGRWTGWTDAIALSAALDVPQAMRNSQQSDDDGTVDGGDRDDRERVRLQLARAIRRDVQAAGRSPLSIDLGYRPFRQCHLVCQQAMSGAIGGLRARARQRLQSTLPDLAQLCIVDATLEQVIGVQERRLLGFVPTLLERHHQRLRETDAGADEWLERFRQDLQAVLLAELALRLEPVDGLLDAMDGAEIPADLPSLALPR